MSCLNGIAQSNITANAQSLNCTNWILNNTVGQMDDGTALKTVVAIVESFVVYPITAVVLLVESVVRAVLAGIAWLASLVTKGETKTDLQQIASRLIDSAFGVLGIVVCVLVMPFIVVIMMIKDCCSKAEDNMDVHSTNENSSRHKKSLLSAYAGVV